MNMSRLFIMRPIGTTLLALGIALAGMFAFLKLPVAPLPQVDMPTIVVQAQMAGASPETMATSVAAPLERRLGAIADVSEMTSMSNTGQTRVILQFNLSRDINGAARDVQAAINAARADLPTSLRSNPTYRKFNPASAPILLVGLSSNTLSAGQLYDKADTEVAQALLQIEGVGDVDIAGSALPAVRAEMDPQKLFHYGISFEDVRAALAAANANSPKGGFDVGAQRYQVYTNDQATKAAQYRDMVVAYRNNAPIRLSDLGRVVDSVEDVNNLGMSNGRNAVILIVFPQPGANLIDTVKRIRERMPSLTAGLPSDVDVKVTQDRTTTIQASLHDTELTLIVAVILVVLVVFAFLQDWRAVVIPAVAVPISIIGTFGAMYLLGYSLDLLSLMALTIATGFVVDDAIVVLENIARHVERGMPRRAAALLGAQEIGPTVLSITLSLVAVFLPILLMSGIVGRLFREFAVTLAISIGISMLVSLTVTPMMCALLISHRKPGEQENPGFWRRCGNTLNRWGAKCVDWYAETLIWSLDHRKTILLILVATVGLNFYMYVKIPKGFFPDEDTGRLIGGIQADQNVSFQAMQGKFREVMAIVQADPAVLNVVGSTGGTGSQTNGGRVFVELKPRARRDVSASEVIARLRPKLDKVAGIRLFLQSAQDIRTGGRQSNAMYQYTLLGDSTTELYTWTNKLVTALQAKPELADVNSDLQQKGLESDITIDRATAARFGIQPAQIDNTLYDAFGQRQVSTIYNAMNQYHVILTVDSKYWQSPDILKQIYISTSGNTSGTSSTNSTLDSTGTSSSSGASTQSSSSTTGADSITSQQTALASAVQNQATNSITSTGNSSSSTGSAVSTSKETMVPLSAIAHFSIGNTPLSVNHQGQFVATTISFNLPVGGNLANAITLIQQTMQEIGVPGTIQGSAAGTAMTAQQSQSDMPLLILAAIAAVYIVLGILYESYLHPVTILSTLPSAGIGALLALRLFNIDFGIIALIGVILLIGIVKKNAIMMIDFAISAARIPGTDARTAIYQACRLRFRPIMMTTLAAILGAVPLTLTLGEGSEMRQPLGVSIVGGLIVSQVLTLYTTPVVYLVLERAKARTHAWRDRRRRKRDQRRRDMLASD
ncbi:nodulation protein [Robbsia andropogonis]|uniref:Nodulation protein n=1 Tax=Robbsia andropogonis TaxID=28092 RepID=A0A0F5JY14_9BURK|nr:efflux RND transporter permease subunit [Robbsia andropogonis]KKB62514.1 nodulation protein [Robbsia andropogonis]MCP1116978.1 efflux RND transporter permease subunit [Robbsia andropogonis]MCP1126343.1 efflux RND transporter permease subunit [Robbsia andropogonis]